MKKNYYILALILFIFFVISFLTNIIGPLVPEIIEDFNLSLTMVAILPMAFFMAYGVLSIPSGILVEKFGEKRIMVLAFSISCLGALILGIYANYLVAIISLFLIGCGMAILQVAINPLLRTVGGEEHFAFYSVLGQLFFGLASFLSPLVYSKIVLGLEANAQNPAIYVLSQLVPEGLSWISMYWIFALVSLIMIVFVGFSKFPQVELEDDEKVGSNQAYLQLLKDRKVLLYFLGIFFYVGTEQGINNWISEFLKTYHGYDPQTVGATVVSRFWGFMTIGTLLGLLLLKLIDSKKVLIFFTLSAMVSLTFALLGSGEISLIAFPAVGFFASVMWSIILSLALNSVKNHHGALSGILVTGIVGGAIWPLVVGALGDAFGLKVGLMALYLSLGYILSIGFWAKPLITNKTINS
ncbi:sugar MFS transporter [Fulvivirga sp. M361]|uniref:MFS transporter n=1 Tax=Fulvivirga sp. M361 TaxID=2594266 RepID=UPI00117AE38E|nr:MFS transporter [Fulvivirga sp. M361]TRX59938.1 sugar MFS transporter [Fulvivirga sp. M361]